MAASAGGCCSLYLFRRLSPVLFPLFILFVPVAWGEGRKLYGPEDQLTILDGGSVRQALFKSPTAWLLEFYSSWCGHCINYAPTWKALADDVRGWQAIIRIGVLDCAEEGNYETCRDFGVNLYPSFKYFKAFTKEFTSGENYKAGSDRDVQTVRQTIIDYLQNSSLESRPLACPSLDPLRSSDVASLLDNKATHYTAILFESDHSYVGREVILDLIQYENIVVNRALDSDKALLEQLGIASVPSCYLIHPNGSHGPVNILKPLRSSFSSHLKLLPDVKKKLLSQPTWPVKQKKETNEVTIWKDYDNTKLYMSDLESGLHYLLRVELAAHKTLEGAKLKTFKDFITVMSKLFPGRQPVVKLLETLQEWLVSLPLDKIPYDAILDLVNNKMLISGIFLTNRIHWVGCKGSRPELRGYTCSLWKLFHSLTVQAALRPEVLIKTDLEDNPQVILQVVRQYIQNFFGCRECAQHFEEMAKDSMDSVETLDQAVLWLWKKHNIVNSRLAGANSEDPKFPKIQWPSPELCPRCHEDNGLHGWNEAEVLAFLKHYYSGENISQHFLDASATSDETQEQAVENKEVDQSQAKKSGEHSPEKGLQNSQHAADVKPNILDKLIQEKRPELVDVHNEMKQSLSFLGIGFSHIDMSLCVVLYVSSSLFLMIMFFFFRMRSRRWKIRYNRPYV
ncbi:sulfhydryl oxidase 2 [Microcaecilia unicolor]|uniref:Sulfhydryl oxidase n=1 Tax=Microcaecilia unicolor TaxID=1415580 RepID=A0A6P7Y7H0_9AMPH|nr:sulfhydryl oxidase 2 [Microcaecilia unicolor]